MAAEVITRHIGPFLLGRTLGSGSNGKVKLGYHKQTGFKVAIKIIDKEALHGNKDRKRKMEREIAILRLLEHPNVLRLYEVYETSKYMFLVLEYVEGGELFDYLIEQGGLPLMQALHFFKQLITGLEYCHRNHICHRDLKPENLLLSADRQTLKLADFGMAAMARTALATSCGSPHYASPEVISGGRYDGKISDVWSCGVILYTLVTGRLPFDDHNVRALLLKVRSGRYNIPKYVAPEVQDLIGRMLVVDPKNRITLAQIRQHPWFTENDVILPVPRVLFDATEQLDSSDSDESSEDHEVTPVKVEPAASVRALVESELDEEIVLTMTALGWHRRHVIKRLTNDCNNMEKAFYRVLQSRREMPAEKYYEVVPSPRRSRKFEENLTVSETARSQMLSESSDDRPRHVLIQELDLVAESAPKSRDMPVLTRRRSQTSTGVPLTLADAPRETSESTQVNSAPSHVRTSVNSPRVRSQSAARKSTARKLYYHDPFGAQSPDEVAEVKTADPHAGSSPKKGNWWTSLMNTFKSAKQESERRQVELQTRATPSEAADVLIAYGAKITKLGKDHVRAKFSSPSDKHVRVKCHLVFEKNGDNNDLPYKVMMTLKDKNGPESYDQICTNVKQELECK